MSLLHGVKKRFILVVVFVLASFLIGFFRNEQASAMIPHKMPRAERSAITKALFGTLYQCLDGGKVQYPGTKQYAGCVDSISEAIGSWYLKQQINSSITFDDGLNSEPDNVTFRDIIEGFKKLIGDNTFSVQEANEILYEKVCLENSITDDCNVIFSAGFDLSRAEEYKKGYFEGGDNAENMYIVELRPNLYGLRDTIQKKYNQTNKLSEGTNQSSEINLQKGYSDAERYWIYWYLMEVAAYHDGGSNEHYIKETTTEAKKGAFKGVKIVEDEAIDESTYYTFRPDIINQDIRYIECGPTCSSIDIDPNNTGQDLPEDWTVGYTEAAIEDIKKHKEQIAAQQAFLDNNTLNANREQAQEEAAADCKNVYEEAWKQSYDKLVNSGILPDKLFNNPNVGQIIPNLNDTQRKLYYLLSDFESTRIQNNRWQPGTTSTWSTYKSAYGNNVFYTAFGEKEFNLNNRSYLIKPDNSKKLSDKVIVYKEVKQKDGSNKKETTGFCYGYLIHQYIEKSIKQILDEDGIENAADLASIEMGEISETTETQFDYDQSTGYAPEGGGSVNYEPDTCYSGSGSLGWILCPLIWGASNVGEGLWDQIETYHLKLPANALFGVREGQTESGVHSAWRSIRDISNIVFVIVFLVIVISQVTGFGITNYGIKKMLPKLIVCIIIVNLSYILCQIAVDLSNTIGASITDFLRGIAEKIPWSITEEVKSDGGLFSNGFITGALIAGGAGGLFALITSMRTGQNGAGAIIGGLGLFVLGIVIIILVAIITLYVTLMIREAAVVVCIAIAPLAIVCNVLPNTQPLFKKWLNLIKALLVLYPVSAFMVGGGQLAGAILASTGLNTMRLAAGVVQVLPYFFVPTLLRKSLAGLGNIGAKIGSLGKTYGRKASHGATGLIKNSRRYQDMLAGSKAKAENRYNRSEEARLRRKQERRRRHGRELSAQDTLRLEAATDKNFSRDTKIEEARVSSEADRVAARRRAASSDIATKDAQLMNGGFGDAANADAFAAARLAQARTETVNARDKLMETYGGAQRDIYTGDMITNPDGSYVIDANRANAYTEGVRLSSQVSTRKEAEEKVAQAAHRQSLYLASARKSDIDLENNLRTARAYSEDMDENGNFVPAGTGTYHASDYVNNQRRTQENKTNSALASGYVRPMETTFAGAHNQAQIRASEEIGKAAESEFREMDKAGPNGLATRMNTMARNIGARDANGNRTFASPGQLETLESSIKVASSRGLEKEAYASYNAALNSFGQAFAEAQASGNTTEMQEIQSRMDSFKRSMQGSSIKAISIHAKQTENMQIDSDMAASDANSYYQGAEFAGYADKKGGNLTIDKDSSAIFQRIGANFSAVHAMEQLGKNDLTQTQITDFATMAERDLASNNTDISKALSARTLVNLPASTITTIASGTSDVNRNALMAAMNNISAQAMEKLTQEQVRALQTLNPNFGNNTSGNAGSNTGSNAGGNAGNNTGSDWGGSSDNDSGPFAI